ncbi:MAG: sigma-70 family RNA polymerase sigma factor [Dehalococcoidia bacterium]|nr:sigma-70 family RNA polymerase sigma factor [Dehalococcoidia bacterium]
MDGTSAASSTEARESDGQMLAARLAQGEHDALAELYDQYAGRAFGLAYRVLGDPGAAEDVVHDAFLWIWEASDKVDARRGHPGALLLTVTHRRAIDVARRRQRGEAILDAFPKSAGISDDGPGELIETLDEAALIAAMRGQLAELAPEQREVVELAYYAGMTQDQIAKSRAIPLGTVKSRLRLAMKKLRAALKAEGQ